MDHIELSLTLLPAGSSQQAGSGGSYSVRQTIIKSSMLYKLGIDTVVPSVTHYCGGIIH
jgi:hypothetical protein